jgi:hypothetical protein
MGRAAAKAAIRRGGVPDAARPRLWLRLLFPTGTAAEGENSSGALVQSYPTLVARAEEHVRLYTRTGRVRRDPAASGVFGVVMLPPDGEGQEQQQSGGGNESSSSSGAARRSNWIAEIEADVQRTHVDRGFFGGGGAASSSSSSSLGLVCWEGEGEEEGIVSPSCCGAEEATTMVRGMWVCDVAMACPSVNRVLTLLTK